MMSCEYRGWELYQTYDIGSRHIKCKAVKTDDKEKTFEFNLFAANLSHAIELSDTVQQIFASKVDKIESP